MTSPLASPLSPTARILLSLVVWVATAVVVVSASALILSGSLPQALAGCVYLAVGIPLARIVLTRV
jgi:hypothetical protein